MVIIKICKSFYMTYKYIIISGYAITHQADNKNRESAVWDAALSVPNR